MSLFDSLPRQLRIAIPAALLLFLFIGFLLGQMTTTFTNGAPGQMNPTYLDLYVASLSNKHANDGNLLDLQQGLCFDDTRAAVENRLTSGAALRPDIDGAYRNVLNLVTPDGCEAYRTSVAGQTGGAGSGGIGNNLLQLLLGVLLLGAVAGGVAWFLSQRGNSGELIEEPPVRRETRQVRKVREPEPRIRDVRERVERVVEPEVEPRRPTIVERVPEPEPVPEPPVTRVERTEARRERQAVAPPPPAVDPMEPQHIGGFSTSYQRGDDGFDKSFIIENANGDFLGECGVSISEFIGSDDGVRNVTAFEIWLFDKNDTHTVTKVVMSDHAFHDEAMRAKLAVRGEPVLAKYGEPIALETNSLIINGEVTDIEYVKGEPARGVFDRFTIDLAAWVKSDLEREAGRASDLLDM